MAQEGEEMVRGPRFELGTPRFSAGCLKRRRGHKSLRHNVGSSPHSCKSFTALHRVARGNVYRIRFGGKLNCIATEPLHKVIGLSGQDESIKVRY